jgi:Mg2+ and Co2+ transporter CorA
VAAFAERAEALERQWQAAGTAEDYFALLRALAPLHRSARNLHAALQQARELAPADRDLINLRDHAGEIERTVELLHGDAKNGLDFTIARQAERQAERTYDMAVSAHRLNLLAAVFLPTVTLSTVFGMNLAHGLEAGGSPAWVYFWGVLVVGLACGVVLAQVVARKPAPITRPAAKGSGKSRERSGAARRG